MLFRDLLLEIVVRLDTLHNDGEYTGRNIGILDIDLPDLLYIIRDKDRGSIRQRMRVARRQFDTSRRREFEFLCAFELLV